MAQYVVYLDNRKEWRWTFYASNGKIIAVSSEGYIRKSDALAVIDLIKVSMNAPVRELEQNVLARRW
jgi:uncharacterized protein